jgi:membrane fusion protein, macrolide-specific efflux system
MKISAIFQFKSLNSATMKLFKKIKNKYLSFPLVIKIIFPILIIGLIWFMTSKIIASKNSAPQYKTAQVAKTNIVSIISTSGSVTSGSNTSIYTSASGQVAKVYAKNGDTVKQGQKIALITLDQDGQKKQNSAWASYLSAKNAVDSAKQNKLSLQNQLESAQLSFNTAQDAVNKINDFTKTDLQKESINVTFTTSQRSLTIAQEKYANADSAVSIANAQLSAAWSSYQQASNTIVAPANGILTNFALTSGMSVANLASSSSSTSDVTQSVGIITNPKNQVTASVSLTEIDVIKVKAGQKVTLTMDAFPDKTFTGQVLAINTNGQSSSGVTSYPTIIVFDSSLPNMYPNMSVSANIIIDSKADILTVPTSAIQTSNGSSIIKVMKNNQISEVVVETGISDTTNTEIISGLNEGDTIVTSTTTNTTTTKTSTTSVFGGGGMGGFGGGGR